MDVREKIRQLRVIKKIPQKVIAGDLNLSLTGYRKIENGEVDISLSRLKQIADYFKIETWKLLLELDEETTGKLEEPIETYMKENEQRITALSQSYEKRLIEKDREISRLIELLEDCSKDKNIWKEKALDK